MQSTEFPLAAAGGSLSGVGFGAFVLSAFWVQEQKDFESPDCVKASGSFEQTRGCGVGFRIWA